MNVTDFKARALQVMAEVSGSGEPVLITKRGKPLVQVSAIPNIKRPKLGHLAGTMEIVGDIVAPVFDEWETLEPKRLKRTSK